MSSPFSPFDPAKQGMAFWLPPGGRGNGISADGWAELADLADADVDPVLTLLAHAGVAAYVAVPTGWRGRGLPQPPHRLWVASLHYHHAEDLLLNFSHSPGR